jgi:putative hydrolase of HD superfamily
MKKRPTKKDTLELKNIANFLYEVGVLSKTPRSGFQLLGSGEQSVAEHVNRAVFIGYTLAMLEGDVDVAKVLKMCLFHDLVEGRVSDLNYVHQKYVKVDEDKALEELVQTVPFGSDMKASIHEYEERISKESILAKEADNLEWIISLKEQYDIGNTRSKEWIDTAMKRLKTETAKKIAAMIMKTNSNDWWFGDRNDEWWVSRNKKK